MAKKKRLGEAEATSFRVLSDTGIATDPSEAIFPILCQDADGVFKPIGTGFFIGAFGLFVTAKHVVEAALDERGQPKFGFGIFQFDGKGGIILRPIRKVTRHLTADVAVGVAAHMTHNTTKAPLLNKVLTLSAAKPAIGNPVSTYAYPKTVTQQEGKTQKIFFEPGFFAGSITQEYPSGRGSFLPGPCYETSMAIHEGASGGPVILGNGRVAGLNSTGLKDDTISYVSCVSSILDLSLPKFMLPNESTPRTTTVRELSKLGIISCK